MPPNDGYRPNVGIVLVNPAGKVFWARRINQRFWQFPQGGILDGESPQDAMYRELHEETGIVRDQVQLLARTRDWLRYEVPKYLRRDPKNYRGQKQIWFLLRFIGGDDDIKLLNSDAPEFEEWKWYDHRRTLREAAFFKRAVYTAVLGEFSRHLNSGKPSPEKLNADKK